MPTPTPDPPRAGIADYLGAGLLLSWRAVSVPLAALPTDWLALLAAFWFAWLLTERSRARPWITIAATAILLAIYLAGQLPAAAAFLRATL